MATKTFNISKIILKHDSESNWDSSLYVPSLGEVIVYDPDDSHLKARFKIGDGIKTASQLDFQVLGSPFVYEEIG